MYTWCRLYIYSMIGIYLIIPDYISVPVKKTHVNCLLLPREHRFFAIAACDHLLGGQEHPEKIIHPMSS